MKTDVSTNQTTIADLPIQGMTCNHCVQSVRSALESLPGVHSADVTLAPGAAKVVYEPARIEPSQFETAIEAAGYRVSVAEPKLLDVEPDRVAIPRLNPKDTGTQEDWNFAVSGMHCASCVARVEDAFRSVPGVKSARANLATERATVAVDPNQVTEARLLAAAKAAGYPVKRSELTGSAGAESLRKERANHLAYWKARLIAGVLLTVPLIVLGYAPLPSSFPRPWVMLPLATLLMIALGTPYFVGAWNRLKQGSTNMDTLISLGTATAYGYSLYHLFKTEYFLMADIPAIFLSSLYGIIVIGSLSIRERLRLRASQGGG